MSKVHWAIVVAVIASFLLAFYYYPLVPDQIATHWGTSGEANGYSGKLFGMFLLPALLLFFTAFLFYIPNMDPLRANVAKFRDYYDRFILLFALFFLYLQVIMISWNLGNRTGFNQLMVPAFAALFYYVGVLISHAKRNWFIGIRTPWTLSSDRVWDRTHEIGGKLFKAFGIASLVGIAFPQAAIGIIIGGAIAVVVWAFVFSYLEYKKENKGKRK